MACEPRWTLTSTVTYPAALRGSEVLVLESLWVQKGHALLRQRCRVAWRPLVDQLVRQTRLPRDLWLLVLAGTVSLAPQPMGIRRSDAVSPLLSQHTLECVPVDVTAAWVAATLARQTTPPPRGTQP